MSLPLVLLIAIAGLILCNGPQRVEQIVYEDMSSTSLEGLIGEITLAGRVEIWSRALYAVQDFPFTGCGLGTFRRVVRILYPLFRIPSTTDIAHAHNIFLQTALDLGLPGLIAYLALLGIAGTICWHCARHGGPLIRATALGLAAGLVGLHTYGLADALALGSKPGIAFWFALGLIAALPRVLPEEKREAAPSSRTPMRIPRITQYIQAHPYRAAAFILSILAILTAGVYLGWHTLQSTLPSQPTIRLPLYPTVQEVNVRAENPIPNTGWVGVLEVVTFSTTDPLTDVMAFYTNILATWKMEAQASDETSWGGIYTQNEGHSVCLLNAFETEEQVWVSIVCGDKRDPVTLPELSPEAQTDP
jgi:hypothetical protein